MAGVGHSNGDVRLIHHHVYHHVRDVRHHGRGAPLHVVLVLVEVGALVVVEMMVVVVVDIDCSHNNIDI